jgi:DNA polymerase phi
MGKRPKLHHRPPVDAATAALAASDPPAQLLAPPDRLGEAAMAPGPLLPMEAMSVAVERPGGAGETEAGAAGAAANRSLSPVGMQIYWNLSSLSMAVREAAALALVRELRAKQDEFAAGGGRGGVAEVWPAVWCSPRLEVWCSV